MIKIFSVTYDTFNVAIMKNIKNALLAVLLCTVAVTFYGQEQIGKTIVASENGFAFGQNVQMAENGKRIAVSGYGISANGVALFDFVDGDWVAQLFAGTGSFSNEETIYSIAMSPNGENIAVGAVLNGFKEDFGNVKIFHYVDSTWVQKGNTIVGESNNELFGRSLAISDNGNRIVVGARLNSKLEKFGGRVGVYEYTNTSWSQLGQSIYGTKEGFKVGSAVAISGDGTQIFMGTNSIYTQNFSNLVPFRGSTIAYKLEDTMWKITDSESGSTSDHFGFSIAISNDAKTFASTASQFNYATGYVNVYRNKNGKLEKIDRIIGTSNQFLGSSVSLSGDGNKIVVGAILSRNSAHLGSVSIYEFNGNSYVQVGIIEGDAMTPNFGISVDMSSDGTTIAVGSLRYNYGVPGSEFGSVRMYDISGLPSPEPYVEEIPIVLEDIIIFPSPATTLLMCENCNGLTEWYIADVTGKKVISFQDNGPDSTFNSIDVSVLQTGIYYAYFVGGTNNFEVKSFIKK